MIGFTEVNPWTWTPWPGATTPNPYQQYGQVPGTGAIPVGLIVGLLILWGIARMGTPARRLSKREQRAHTRTAGPLAAFRW